MNSGEKKKMKEGMKKTIGRLAIAHVKKGTKWYGANLHVVSVLCICCFIDALGKYIYGGNADKCKFKRFIENYMPNFYRVIFSNGGVPSSLARKSDFSPVAPQARQSVNFVQNRFGFSSINVPKQKASR